MGENDKPASPRSRWGPSAVTRFKLERRVDEEVAENAEAAVLPPAPEAPVEAPEAEEEDPGSSCPWSLGRVLGNETASHMENLP